MFSDYADWGMEEPQAFQKGPLWFFLPVSSCKMLQLAWGQRDRGSLFHAYSPYSLYLHLLSDGQEESGTICTFLLLSIVQDEETASSPRLLCTVYIIHPMQTISLLLSEPYSVSDEGQWGYGEVNQYFWARECGDWC